MTPKVFTLQIGKCGIQTGHEFWKNIYKEHYLNPDGKINFNGVKNFCDRKEIFMEETSIGNFVPRTFLFDLEPRILYNLMNSNYRQIYQKKNILFSNQSTGNNWANGYYRSVEFQSEIEESLRKSIEKFDTLNSFNIFHSIAGGTGGGASAYLLEVLRDEFPGKFINCYSMISDRVGASDTVLQPYNSILSFRWLSLYSDCVTFFENAAIEKIINSSNKQIQSNFQEINYLIAKVISVSSENIRFSSNSRDFWENSICSLIPTPNLHFLSAGITNIQFFDKKNKKSYSSYDLAKQIFENKTISFSPDEGKIISSLHFIRNKIGYFQYLNLIKQIFKAKNLRPINWSNIAVQISNLNQFLDTDSIPTEVGYFNHTKIKDLFVETKTQYDVLRKRNAFLTNYLQNFPSNDGAELFNDARESIESLIDEYRSVESSNYV